MIDLTWEDRTLCFSPEERRALEKVAHDGYPRWVQDMAGSMFSVEFADTCLTLTGFNTAKTGFLVSFEDVHLAARTRWPTGLYSLKKVPECQTST